MEQYSYDRIRACCNRVGIVVGRMQHTRWSCLPHHRHGDELGGSPHSVDRSRSIALTKPEGLPLRTGSQAKGGEAMKTMEFLVRVEGLPDHAKALPHCE